VGKHRDGPREFGKHVVGEGGDVEVGHARVRRGLETVWSVDVERPVDGLAVGVIFWWRGGRDERAVFSPSHVVVDRWAADKTVLDEGVQLEL